MGLDVISIDVLVGIAASVYIVYDSKKRGMNQLWALIGILFIVIGPFGFIGLIIYLIARKPILLHHDSKQHYAQTESNIISQNSIQDITIPKICPHCKSPNSKLVRECEWCGNQII